MTLFQIGRTVIDTSTSTKTSETTPATLNVSGNTISLSGSIKPPTRGEGRVFKEQWQGYTPGTELPFIAPESFDLTGLYTVTGSSVSAMQNVTDKAGVWDYSITLVRTPAAKVETSYDFVSRQTAVGGTFPSKFYVVESNAGTSPNTRYSYTSQNYTNPADVTVANYPDDTPTTLIRSEKSITHPATDRVEVVTRSEPESFYAGGAVIEAEMVDPTSGALWYPVTGLSIPEQINGVRLSNGLWRFQLTKGTQGQAGPMLACEQFNGTVWAQQSSVKFTQFGGLFPVEPGRIEILENSPAVVRVRWSWNSVSVASEVQQVDLVLTRGVDSIMGYWYRPDGLPGSGPPPDTTRLTMVNAAGTAVDPSSVSATHFLLSNATSTTIWSDDGTANADPSNYIEWPNASTLVRFGIGGGPDSTTRYLADHNLSQRLIL